MSHWCVGVAMIKSDDMQHDVRDLPVINTKEQIVRKVATGDGDAHSSKGSTAAIGLYMWEGGRSLPHISRCCAFVLFLYCVVVAVSRAC